MTNTGRDGRQQGRRQDGRLRRSEPARADPPATLPPPAFVPLDTKLQAPPRPGRVIHRPRVVAELSREAASLVVLSAPAGSGKTIAVHQWLEADARPWAWLQLDAGDNDPVTLLHYLARTLLSVSPLDPAVLEWLDLPEPPVRRVILPALVRAASSAPSFALVLDDGHTLTAPRCWQLLAVLTEGLSPGSSLVVSGRSDPPLPLARLRSQGRLVERRFSDLAFDRAEIRDLMALHGLAVDDAWLEEVSTATEGWAAGVYLVVLSSRSGKEVRPSLPSGDRSDIAQYLSEEVLRRTPRQLVEFLTRTAIVDRLCPALCDEVTGRADSAMVLEELVHENLFLVPLDDRRCWYRYHHLFRDLLLAELGRREPLKLPVLHRRAARWFEREGHVSEALHHLMAGGDVALAADLVARSWWPCYLSGRTWTARRWLEVFTNEQLREHVPLRVAAAWAFAFTGDPDRARGLLAGLDAASLEGQPSVDRTASPRSSLALLRALLASDGPLRMREDALEAVRLEEASPGPWPSFCWLVLGIAEMLCGDDEAAAGPLRRAALHAKVLRNGVDLSALGNLSLLAGDADRWDEAIQYALEAVARADAYATGGHLPTAAARLARDRISAREGDDDAVADIEEVLEQSSRDFCPWVRTRAALLLAEARLARHEWEDAGRQLEEARATLERWAESPGMTRRLEDLERRLVALSSSEPPSPAELRVLALLPTNLTAAEIACRLGVSPNTVGSHIGSLHRKLGARHRSEVVERAVALGLLPGVRPPR